MERKKDIVLDAIKHYGVEVSVVILLAALTVLWNVLARGVTVLFSRIKISGEWETTLDRGPGPQKHEEVKLRQFIHKVWGQTTTVAGKKRYRFQGTISGDRLCLIYRDASGGFECGANLLSIAADAESMKGYEIGVKIATNEIYSYPYVWTKKS